jgi:hypothetical protein
MMDFRLGMDSMATRREETPMKKQEALIVSTSEVSDSASSQNAADVEAFDDGVKEPSTWDLVKILLGLWVCAVFGCPLSSLLDLSD